MKKSLQNRINIQQGDITELTVDAIVNAANSTLLGGGGVDGAIHRAAGPELLVECKKIGGCPTGEARLTRGYNLPADYVIHTVGPVYRGSPDDSRQLAACYLNSLSLADTHDIRTIAFPAISCGVYGYPVKDACQIAIETTLTYLERHASIERVIFILFSDKYGQIYEEYLGGI